MTAAAAVVGIPDTAHAVELGADGEVVFAPDALHTESFESLTTAQTSGAAWLTITPQATLSTTPLDAASWATSVVTLPQAGIPAMAGKHALKVAVGTNVGLGIVDTKLFSTLTEKRLTVTFWGYSVGAEPELDLVYPNVAETHVHNSPVGPAGLGRVIAIRTGRETSDGWAEYSTGPVDGSVWGTNPLSSINLTARYATTYGETTLDSVLTTSAFLQPSAYALIDSVEIVASAGAATAPTVCSNAGLVSGQDVCGTGGECVFGRCVDGAFVWGPLPAAADHRTDLVSRWVTTMTELIGDRNGAATARETFTSAAVSALETSKTAAQLFGGLTTLTNSVRAGHTSIGPAPSNGTPFSQAYGSLDSTSGYLDLCFGLAENDLPSRSGETGYSVYWLAPESAVGGAAAGGVTLAVGDMLTALDGVDPDTWMTAVQKRFGYFRLPMRSRSRRSSRRSFRGRSSGPRRRPSRRAAPTASAP